MIVVRQVASYSLSPAQPHAWDTVVAAFTGNITDTIDDGIINVNLTLSHVVPLRANISLSSVADVRSQLPLKPGPFALKETGTSLIIQRRRTRWTAVRRLTALCPSAFVRGERFETLCVNYQRKAYRIHNLWLFLGG